MFLLLAWHKKIREEHFCLFVEHWLDVKGIVYSFSHLVIAYKLSLITAVGFSILS
jgi:hypothetical protein